MLKMVATYFAVAVPFLALDAIWLRTMVPILYTPVLGDLMKSEPNIAPAATFYLSYPLGLVTFAVWPALQEESLARAVLSGLMFGFFTYATYDLTNHATLRNWSTTLTLADVTWGSVLAACSAGIAYLTIHRSFVP